MIDLNFEFKKDCEDMEAEYAKLDRKIESLGGGVLLIFPRGVDDPKTELGLKYVLDLDKNEEFTEWLDQRTKDASDNLVRYY